jgi:hypothetical protein
MTVFYWIAFAVFLIVALPCAFLYARYLASGKELYRLQALRFYRWTALVALTTFNVAIFAGIVETLVNW